MELDKLIDRIAEEVYKKIKNENNGALNVTHSSNDDIAAIIDHTILKPTTLVADIEKLSGFKFKK